MTAADTDALIERYWTAFATKDIETAIACFSEAIVYEDLAIQQVHRGRDDVRAFWEMYFAAAGEAFTATRTSKECTASGYHFEWTVTGVIDGSFGIFRGDGQSFEIRGVSVGEVREGRIAHNRDYWNLAAVMAQLGQTELPAAAAG